MTLGGILNGLAKRFRALPILPNSARRELYKAAEMYRAELNYRGCKKGADYFKTYCPLDAHRLKSYKSIGIPALLAVAILSQTNKDNWSDLEWFSEDLTTQQKAKLNELAESDKFQTLRQRVVLFNQLGKNYKKLDDLVDGACALDESRIAILPDIIGENDDALEYCIGATDAQIKTLENISTSKRDSAVCYIRHLSDEFLPHAEFAIQALRDADDIYTFFKNGIQKTLEALATLDQKTRKECCASRNPGTTGILLRAFDGLPTDEYNSFVLEIGKGDFRVKADMEDHLKLFTDNYCTFPEQKRQDIIKELWGLCDDYRHFVMALTNDYGYDSDAYRAGMEIKSISIEYSMKRDVLDNEILTAKMLKLPESTRRAYIQFTRWLGADDMEQMTIPDFKLAEQAYMFVDNNNDMCRFVLGLEGAVNINKVGPWAETIIKHYQSKSVGGNQYNRMDVIAA
jgi:hypothetical protein